jgi:hypothetical protein
MDKIKYKETNKMNELAKLLLNDYKEIDSDLLYKINKLYTEKEIESIEIGNIRLINLDKEIQIDFKNLFGNYIELTKVNKQELKEAILKMC